MNKSTMIKPNPCRHCRGAPSCGYYAGDFAIECNNCRSFVSKHFVDFPHQHFQTSARLTKEATIRYWNTLNPNPKETDRGTQFEAQ